MIYEVLLTDKASRQLEAAATWWAENQLREQAERWYVGFIESLRSLGDNPERFALARENDAFPVELRQLVYGSGRRKTHRAIFAIRSNQVVVYAIRHVAQRTMTTDDI